MAIHLWNTQYQVRMPNPINNLNQFRQYSSVGGGSLTCGGRGVGGGACSSRGRWVLHLIHVATRLIPTSLFQMQNVCCDAFPFLTDKIGCIARQGRVVYPIGWERIHWREESYSHPY